MSGEQKISVVLATKDRLHLLRGAIESLSAQTCSSYELIVVNDGGPSVADLIQTCNNSRQVRYIEFDVSRGLSAARNAGLEIASGTAVSFLDDDDRYLPHAIETFIDKEPKKMNVVYFDCVVSQSRRNLLPNAKDSIVYNFDFSVEKLHICNHLTVISAVCWGVPPETLKFDINLAALEDWDLWLSIYKRLQVNFIHHRIPTSIYYRVPSERSMTNEALNTDEGRNRYTRSYVSICNRYPYPSGRVRRGRHIYQEFENQIRWCIHKGRSLRQDAYEELLHRLDSLIENFDGPIDWAWLESCT